MSRNHGLILEDSLQSFFFEHLQEINRKSLRPLSQETIFYSSIVMDKFGESSNLFETYNEKVKEKILGIKLLETSQLTKEQQKKSFKDIADTSLFVCGFFSESFNKKLIDISYYENIGKIAYTQLNSMLPDFYDVPAFYKKLAHQFSDVTLLMRLVARQYAAGSDPAQPWLIVNNKKM